MARKKIVLKINHPTAYSVVSDALESGLQFAMNRLEDHGVRISDSQREASLPNMLNELMIALDMVDWDKSK